MELSYDEAFARLEKLVIEIEDETTQLDALSEKVKLATEYLKLCEMKLRTIEDGVRNASAIS